MAQVIDELRLGDRLRQFREKAGLSRDGLAQAVGLSAEAISSMESGRQVPSLGELIQLAHAVQVPVGLFFSPESPLSQVEFVRAADRWKVQASTDQATALNYRYEALSYRLTQKLMSPFLIEVTPNDSVELPLSSHEGEEFLFLLSGELLVTIEDHTYAMRVGDSLYFNSRLKHSVRPLGSQPARFMACIAQDHKQVPANPIDRSFS